MTGVLAVDVDFVRLPTTPLEILVTTLVISLVVALAIMLVTLVLAPLVDKRWPATQPLNPTELLWAETGGYVQNHFRGLDFDIARDVAGQMTETKVKAGQYVFEQGDPAAAFFVVKDGEVEVLQRVGAADQVIRTYGPGDSFGEVAILRRSARTAGVRATKDTTLLELPADEFVAATALSAAEENPLLTAVDRYLAEDRARLAGATVVTDRAAAAPARPPATAQPAAPAPAEPTAPAPPEPTATTPSAPPAPPEEPPPAPRPRRSALLDTPPAAATPEVPVVGEPAPETPTPRRRRFLADEAAPSTPSVPTPTPAEPPAAAPPAPAPAAPAAEAPPPVAPVAPAAPQPAQPAQPAAFAPTHRAPGDGALAWDYPDANRQPVAQLPPGEFVQVVSRHGDWVQVRLASGWQGWVDGRRLYPA